MWALTLYHFEMYRFACIFHSLARYLYLIRKEEIKNKIKSIQQRNAHAMQKKRKKTTMKGARFAGGWGRKIRYWK